MVDGGLSVRNLVDTTDAAARPRGLTLERQQARIAAVFDELKAMVLAKNERYGGAMFAQDRWLSDGLPEEAAILVRIDDKLRRIKAGAADDDEDPVRDVIGYLVGLLVLREYQQTRAGVVE